MHLKTGYSVGYETFNSLGKFDLAFVYLKKYVGTFEGPINFSIGMTGSS
jgi:hypothetical protein